MSTADPRVTRGSRHHMLRCRTTRPSRAGGHTTRVPGTRGSCATRARAPHNRRAKRQIATQGTNGGDQEGEGEENHDGDAHDARRCRARRGAGDHDVDDNSLPARRGAEPRRPGARRPLQTENDGGRRVVMRGGGVFVQQQRAGRAGAQSEPAHESDR